MRWKTEEKDGGKERFTDAYVDGWNGKKEKKVDRSVEDRSID